MPRLTVGAAAVLLLFAAAFGLGRATRSSGGEAAALSPAGASASAPISGLSSVGAVPALRVVHHRAAVKHVSAAPKREQVTTPSPSPTPAPATSVAPARRAPAAPLPPTRRAAPSKPAPDETIIGGGGGG